MYAISLLHYQNELIEAGVPDKQAIIHAEQLARVLDDNFATKKDLNEFKAEVKEEINHLRHDVIQLEIKMDAKFKAVDARFDAIESKFNAKFDAIDVRFDSIAVRFDSIDIKFDAIETKLIWLVKLVSVLGGVIALSTALPNFYHLFS